MACAIANPSVNSLPNILNLKFAFLSNFQILFNISYTLELKVMKSPSQKPTCWTYSQNIFQQYKKGTPIFLFSVLIFKLNNNSHVIGLNISKPPQYTAIHWRLSNHTKDTMGTTMVGSFQCNKQKLILKNKLCVMHL